MAASPRLPWEGKKTGPNPTDRGKSGTKISLAVEGAGVPLAVVIAGANRNDHLLLPDTLEQLAPPTDDPEPVGLCLDKGYDFEAVRVEADKRHYQLHLRRRGEDRPEATPGWRPRRWVVERTFSWLHRFRRLLVRWEKKADLHKSLLHLACALRIHSIYSLAG